MSARRSERFASRERRELRREVLISPYPELGLVAMDGPNDPEPGLELEDGRVVAMDGRRAEDFDIIDRFVARYGVDLDVAAEAALLADDEIARRLVDVDVPRVDLVRLSRGLTPARLARVAGCDGPTAPSPSPSTRRSAKHASSRTFPGHGCPKRKRMVSGVGTGATRPNRFAAWLQKCSYRSGMSARRSRSGGMRTVTTLRR